MSLRASIAVLMAITLLGIGLVGVSTMSQNASDAASTPTENESVQLADNVYEGVGGVTATAVVWGGVAAVILIPCGILAFKTIGGGRR